MGQDTIWRGRSIAADRTMVKTSLLQSQDAATIETKPGFIVQEQERGQGDSAPGVGNTMREKDVLKAIRIRINLDSIRKIMARRNLLNHDIAIKLETSPKYWSQLITGRRNPGPEMRKRIQFAFGGCSWDSLFKIDE